MAHGSSAQQAPFISPRLYACRDAARLLLGDDYQRKVSELGAALQTDAQARKCTLLDAAMQSARGRDGVDALQILAAAVEILEPST